MTIAYCEWCGSEFIRTTNKVYCTSVCREFATRHYAALQHRRATLLKRQQQSRTCNRCGKTLSLYNDNDVCTACLSYGTIKRSDILKRMHDDTGG